MADTDNATIDALFGSKTRVKLLHLFLNNPNKQFYVREITRLVDEQINSVRRELKNLLAIGIIGSKSADNKLYYEVNRRYQHYASLREIFTGERDDQAVGRSKSSQLGELREVVRNWAESVRGLSGLRVAIAAGVLVKGSASRIDLLLAGDLDDESVQYIVADTEKLLGKEVRYSVMHYEEFYYRLSVRDQFVVSVLDSKHVILADVDRVLSN